jgi:hypothetical protein
MRSPNRRSVWQVNTAAGDVLFFSRLRSLVLELRDAKLHPTASILHRAGRGSYFWTETYSTGAGVRVRLGTAIRVSAARAEVERTTPRLQFDDETPDEIAAEAARGV